MVRLEGISKQYATGTGIVKILSRISFQVEKGSLALVLGKSGSGKTTLLNCIGGLDTPDNGSVECFGTQIHQLKGKRKNLFRRRQLGFVFQSGNLLSSLSVRRNIEFPLVLNNYPKRQKKERVDFLLDRLGLEKVADTLPAALSGGQAQRAAFARGVAHRPQLLLADEPTASLDTQTGLKLIRLMHELSKEDGIIMIVATHDHGIIPFADFVMHLTDGQIKGKMT